MKHHITTIFMILCTCLSAQDWQALYFPDSSSSTIKSITTHNDTIYAFWNRYDDLANYGCTLVKIDTSGRWIDTLNYFDSSNTLTTYYTYSKIQVLKNRKAVIYGSTTSARLFLIFFDLATRRSQIVYFSPFSGNFQWQGNTTFLATSTGLYLTGVVQSTDTYGTLNAFVIHTDLDGNEIWRKTYGQPGVEDLALSIVQKSENEIVIGGGRFSSFGNIFLPTSEVFGKELFITIDTMGKQLSEWVSTGTQNFSAVSSMHYFGGKFYYSGSYATVLQNDFEFLSYMGCRDSNLNVLWRTPINRELTFLQNKISNTAISPDSLYIMGSGVIHWVGPLLHFKVRLSDGAVEFQRQDTICVPNMLPWGSPPLLWPYEAALYDIATLSSGSTVSCGTADVQTTEGRRKYGYILKTNAWGEDLLEDCSTVSSSEPQYTQNELFIYPNPCSNLFTLEPPAYAGAYRVRMYASTGALALEQACVQGEKPEIQVSELNSGLYFVQLLSEKGQLLGVGKVVKE
jgi:hypothetical protein